MATYFIHMSNHRKKHDRYLTTRTLDTNITSGTGDEKSNSTTNKFESEIRKKSNYLRSIENYFKKQMALKYNTLPNEYNLMQLDNFITGKYCRALASFKEKLMYYYIEEFLKRYYTYPETVKKLPLFYEFYKSYLKFFCSPTLSDLKLNELIENMVEKKAKAFYNENFKEDKPTPKTKIISTIIFSNKVRRDISRRSTLTDLSKTTIVNNNLTNKSSITSLGILNKLLSEISSNKPPIINCSVNDLHQKKNNYVGIKKSSKNVNKENNHKINSLNQSGITKSVLSQKFKKLPTKKSIEQPIKISKGTSKSNQLSISPSGHLSKNRTLKPIKKSTGNINLNNQINGKKIVHKKTSMSRNYENNLESKINFTQSTLNNNQLQSLAIHTSNTSLQGYVNTQSGVKSKTRKILKIPKTQINNNKIVNNNNLTNNLNKNITYNVNTPVSTNFNLSSNTLTNLYHNNNMSKENKIIEKKISANELGKIMPISTNTQNSKFGKNVKNWKNLSPNKKENTTNCNTNNNNNCGIVSKKISSSKFGAFKLIPPKNYLFKPKTIKKK